MAAIASVSFTTVSSATLVAGTFAFFAGQAGAEDLTHDPILTQQLDHAKQIEFGKLSLSETGAEQVENNVAKSSFGSGDVAHLAAAATLGGDIVDAVLCEGYSEAGGSWQADAAALSSTLDPAATSEFVTAEGLATVDSGEPVFSTTAAAAPAAATSALDLAPQQDNSYNATTATGSSSSSNNTSVSAPAVGAGAGAGSFGGGSGYVASSRSSRPVVMKTAGVTLQDVTTTDAATQDSVSVNLQDSLAYDEITRQETAPQPRLAAAAVDAQSTPANSGTLLNVTPEGFTANPYATGTESANGSDPVFEVTPAAAAAVPTTDFQQQATTESPSSGTTPSTTGTATESVATPSGAAGFGGISTPTLGLSTSSLGSTTSNGSPALSIGSALGSLGGISVGGGATDSNNLASAVTLQGAISSSPTAENAAGWFVLDTTTGTWTRSSNCSVSGNSYSFTEGGSAIHFNNNTGATNRAVYTFAFTVDLAKLENVTVNTILLRAGSGSSYISGVGMTKDRNLTLTWGNTAQYNGWSFAQLGSEGLVTIVLTEGNAGGYLSAYKNDAQWTVLQTRNGSSNLKGTGDVTQFTLGSELANAITAFAVWQTSDTWVADNMLSAAKALSDLPLSEGLVWNGTSDSHTWTNNSSTPWIGGTFTSGADVIFDNSASNKVVLIQSAIRAGFISVKSDNYTFSFSGESSLSMSKLTIDQGATLKLEGDGNPALSGPIVVDGTLEGWKYTGNSGNAAYGSNITGSGTIKVTGELQYHSQTYMDGFTGTVELCDGAVLQVGDKATKLQNARELIVSRGAYIKGWGGTAFSRNITLNGGTLADAGADETYSGSIKLTADSYVEAASGKTVTLSGAISGDYGMTKKSAGTAKFTQSGGVTLKKFTIEQGTAEFTGKLSITGNDWIAQSGGSTLKLLGGLTFNGSGGNDSYALQVTGNSTAIMSGTSDLTGKKLGASGGSTIKFAEGSTTTAKCVMWTVNNVNNNGSVVMEANSTLKVQDDGIWTPSLSMGEGSALDIAVTSPHGSRVENVSGSGSINLSTGKLVMDGSGSNYSGAVTISGGTLEASSVTGLGTGAVTLNSGTLDLSANSAYATGAITMSSGTLKLAGEDMLTSTGSISLTGGTLDLTRLSVDGTRASYTLASATGALTLGSVDFTLANESLKSMYQLDASDGHTLVLMLNNQEHHDLVWQGGNAYWTTNAGVQDWYLDDETGTESAFAAGDNVRFDSRSADATVTLGSAVSAGRLTVDETANVSVVSNGNSLTAQSYQVNGTLTVDCSLANLDTEHVSGTGTLAFATGVQQDISAAMATATAPKFLVQEGATLRVTEQLTGDGADMSHISNMGTVQVSAASPAAGMNLQLGSDSTGKLQVDGGTVSYQSHLGTADSTLVLNNSTLVFGGTEGRCEFNSNVELMTDASFKAVNLSGDMVVNGDVSGAGKTLTRDGGGGCNLVFKGNVDLGTYREDVTGRDTAVYFEGETTKIGSITFKTGALSDVFFVGTDAQVDSIGETHGTLMVEDNSQLSLSGNCGTGITVEDGSLVMTGTDKQLVYGTISLDRGSTLTFSGTDSLDVGYMHLYSGSIIDLRNVHMGEATSVTLAVSSIGSKYGFDLHSGVTLINGEELPADKTYKLKVGDDGKGHEALFLVKARPRTDLLWQGGNGTWTTSEDAFDWYFDNGETTETYFAEEDNIRFDSRSDNATVTLESNMIAHIIRVDEGVDVTLDAVYEDYYRYARNLEASAIVVDGELTTNGKIAANQVAVGENGRWIMSVDSSVTYVSGFWYEDEETFAYTPDGKTEYSGEIVGEGKFVKQGDGELALTGKNQHEGGTEVQGGTVVVTTDTALGNGSVDLREGTSLQVGFAADDYWFVDLWSSAPRTDENRDLTIANAIHGEGKVVKNGDTVLTMSGTSTYTGGTEVKGGTLVATATGALGTGTVTMAEGTALVLDTDSEMTLGNTITGACTLTKTGSGSATLTGNSTYAGPTTVQEGTLVVGSAGALGTSSIYVLGGSTLDLGVEYRTTGDMMVDTAATLTLAGNAALTANDLSLLHGAALDLTRITFGENDARVALATATGTLTIEKLDSIWLANSPSGHAVSLVQEGNTLYLVKGDALHDLVWQGGYGAWNRDSTVQDWYLAGTETASAFSNHDNVRFDYRSANAVVNVGEELSVNHLVVDAGAKVDLAAGAAGNAAVGVHADQLEINGTLSSAVAVDGDLIWLGNQGLWQLDTTTGDRTVAGKLMGRGDLDKVGSGTLTLTGDNSAFGGIIQLGGGTLVSGNGTALGTAPVVELAGGTELQGTVSAAGGALFQAVAGDAAAVLSANVAVAENQYAEFTGAGTLNVTGNISGAGGVLKTGTGTVVLSGTNTYMGDTVVSTGTLVLAGSLVVADGSTMDLNPGATLWLQDTELVTGSKLTLGYGSVLDLKGVTFTNNRADLARVGTLDAMFSDMNHGEISNRWMVEGVALHNVAGEGGTNYARLRYRNENGKTVLYAELVTPESAPSTARGVYWNGGETGTWDIGNSSNLVWRTQESGGKEAYYTTDYNINYSRSAYFVDDITANIVVPDNLDYVKDVIVTKGTYNFSTTNPNAYLKLSVDVQSSIIVRSGAEANFGFAINSGDGSFIHVEEGAVLTAHDTNYNENQLFNAQVEGTMDLLSYNVYVKRLTNTGDTKIVATGVTEVQSGIQAERISNTGKLYISGTSLRDAAAAITGAAPIANEGTLTLASLLDEKSGHRADFNVYMPIEGHGEVLTEGADKVVVHRTVEADKLELDAADSVFQADVQAAESTEVKEGKTGSFMGGATLQGDTLVDKDATLVFGNAKAATTDTGYETFSYQVDRITADTAEAVKVQRGATVNVGTLSAAESTVVLGGGDVNPERVERIKATLVTSGPAVMDDLQVLDNHATGTFNGTATIGTIHQDGGTVVLNAGGSIGTGKTTGGTVSAGTLTLGARLVLDQNAVIDVAKGGTYTLTATTGHVDATDLELLRTKGGFCEIYSNKEVTDHQTTWESGFMASGNELVQLYKPEQEGGAFTLTSNDMRVQHADASGTMTLIGTDNKENFRAVMGTQDMVVDNYVGWAYLNTSETNYLTYFIRDDYVTGNLNGRVSDTGEEEKGGGKTTLSVIKTVANGQLTGIVFDLTDYNTAAAVTGYDGTLTVDTDSTADFFAVAAKAEAMLNITRAATVTADGSYKGVSGTLDLQGEGVYEIKDRADLGANVSLRNNESGNTDEWNGTVRIKGTSEDLNIDNMSVGKGTDASTIEFNHWSGSLVGEEHASDAYINLVGTGLSESDTAAITITGGESAMQYTWNNAVTGDYARILHEDGPGMELTLCGDTSGWTGLYVQQAGTVDSLTYMGGDAVSSGASVSDGTLNVTYGGTVTRVGNEDDTLADNSMGVYNAGSKLNVNYTTEATRDEEGTVKGKTEVYSTFSTDGRGDLAINVGDGAKTTVVDFKGGFYNTGNATVSVNKDSEANFLVDAELLRVVGDTGSTVTVSDGETLALASTDAKNSYSEFHNLDNEGTIIMKADGGSIHLVVDEEAEGEFNMGHLELDGSAGTAHVGTDATNGKGKAVVNIQDLKSSTTGEQKLMLENLGGTNEVDYRLGLSEGTTDAQFHGKIRFGSESADPVGGTTRVVLGSTNVAADAVLESVGYGNTADVVVDTANASVQGITSADGDSVRGRLYGTGKNTAVGSSNNQVTITGSDTYSYNGGLGEHLDIAYTGNGKQTFEGGATGFNGDVTVDNNSTAAGVLEILNVKDSMGMKIEDLTIGANNTLVVKQGENVDSADSNVTVSGTLLAKGGSTRTPEGGSQTGSASRMDASLTLASGSTLDVSNAVGMGGLDLGGSMTITSGAYLSGGDIANLLAMDLNTKYDLAFDVVGVNFASGPVDETAKLDASQYFANLGKGEYYICYTANSTGGFGGNVGTVYLYKAAPEPTTGTLSLLALAALCARRRRKA